jgi:hypothetical protein
MTASEDEYTAGSESDLMPESFDEDRSDDGRFTPLADLATGAGSTYLMPPPPPRPPRPTELVRDD